MTAYQVMPRLSAEDYADLRKSIEKSGVLVPVVVNHEGQIIDGHHRAEIADELRITWPSQTVSGTPAEMRSMAYALNLHRRHLNSEQRKELIRRSLTSDPELSNREHARRTGVSDKTVAVAREPMESGAEIPHHPTRTDARGVQQPARKPEPIAKVTETTKTETFVDTTTGEVTGKPAEWVSPTTIINQKKSDPEPEALSVEDVLSADPEVQRSRYIARFYKAIQNAGRLTEFQVADVANLMSADEFEAINRLVDGLTRWRDDITAAQPRHLRSVQ